MRISTVISIILLVLAPKFALADLSLKTQGLEIWVDEKTSFINKINIQRDDENKSSGTPALTNGNLLSLDWPEPLQLLSQRLLSDNDGSSISSQYQGPSGLLVTRTVKPGSSPYSLLISYQLTNASSKNLELSQILPSSLHFAQGFEAMVDEGGGYSAGVYGYRDFFLAQDDGVERHNEESFADLGGEYLPDWFGWINRYYVIALKRSDTAIALSFHLPQQNQPNSDNQNELSPQTLAISQHPKTASPSILKAGEVMSLRFESIIAPKQWLQLSSIEPSLEGVVLISLWDWFRGLCYVIWQLIEGLYQLIGNWGLTIIATALVVRILTIPITRLSLQYQQRATQQQERINPLIQELKTKYKGIDLSEQIVALYKRENYDQLAPFKGMSGLFIQIPIFIALFNVLGEAPELSGVSFLWINDLALSDRLFSLGVNLPFFGAYCNLLPILMALITVLSTYYAGRKSGQKDMTSTALFGMAGIFFILFYSFPSALVLYWTCSTLFQLIQQVIANYIETMKARHLSK